MKSLQLSKPHLLVMVGIPGSGKTTFASQFAAMFKTPFVDAVQLNQLTEGNIELTYQIIHYVLEQLLRTGQTVIVDGPGDSAIDRRELVSMAHKFGYTPLFIWVQTEPVTAEMRAVRSRTAAISKAEFDQRVANFDYLTNAEPVMVISGKHTFSTQARIVLKKLTSDRAVGASRTHMDIHQKSQLGSQTRPRPDVNNRGRLIR